MPPVDRLPFLPNRFSAMIESAHDHPNYTFKKMYIVSLDHQFQ